MYAKLFIWASCLDLLTAGRVDYSSMDDQTLMELLVMNMNDQWKFKGHQGDFLDISKWPGVHLDNNGKVLKFGMKNMLTARTHDEESDGGGSIDLKWIPDSLLNLSLVMIKLDGTIDTELFPRSVISFNIYRNKFTGTFCMEFLPKSMENIIISYNRLQGTLHLSTNLPSLREFFASDNFFTGTLDMSSLPSGMLHLDLRRNMFSGRLVAGESGKEIQFLEVDDYLYR